MKKLLASIAFVLTFLFSFADSETVIVKVNYSKKKDGFHSFIILDIGKSNTHSLYRNITNESEGSVSYKDDDGKIKVFTSEIDLMNFLFTLGYTYKEVYQTTIMTENYTNFILVKP